MLIQLPGGSPDQPGSRGADECSPFEAGLRRDLASAPIVSYDQMLGGPGKRAIDLLLTLLALPLWLPIVEAMLSNRTVSPASATFGFVGSAVNRLTRFTGVAALVV